MDIKHLKGSSTCPFIHVCILVCDKFLNVVSKLIVSTVAILSSGLMTLPFYMSYLIASIQLCDLEDILMSGQIGSLN